MSSKKFEELSEMELRDKLLLAIQNAVNVFEPDFQSLLVVLGAFVLDSMEKLDSLEPGLGYKWRDVLVKLLNQIDITEYENEEREA